MQLPWWTTAICTLFLLQQPVLAQKDKTKNRDVEIIDFGDDKKPTKARDYKGTIFKTSPTTFIFGRQSLEWEKQVKDFLSLQIGLGLTFGPLFDLSEINQELRPDLVSFCESTQWAFDECDYYSDNSIRKGGIGPLVSFSPRLFFESEGFEGAYIAPVLRWSSSKYKVQQVAAGEAFLSRTEARQDEYSRNFDLVVHYGNQYLFPQLTFEWFVGGGVRLNHSLRQDVGVDATGAYQNGERDFKQRSLRGEVGIRVGFQY